MRHFPWMQTGNLLGNRIIPLYIRDAERIAHQSLPKAPQTVSAYRRADKVGYPLKQRNEKERLSSRHFPIHDIPLPA